MYLLMLSSSYKAGKVDEGNSLRIFSPHTIAVGMSNVDVHIETLGNIGRILNINIQMTKSMSIYIFIAHRKTEVLHEVEPLL